MKKGLVLIAGIASVLPALSIVVIPMIFSDAPGKTYDEAKAHHDFFRTIIIYDLAFIYTIMLALLIFMFTTPWVPKEKRALWVVALFFANLFVYPFFWYYYIWRTYGKGREANPSAP